MPYAIIPACAGLHGDAALAGAGAVALRRRATAQPARRPRRRPRPALRGAGRAASPNETNAERAKTQPGNNAPFWRAGARLGQARGLHAACPAREMGMLIQPFVQYPGSRFTTAGEAWRQVRNNWIIPVRRRAALDRAGGDRRSSTGARGRSAMHDAETGPQDRALHALRARRALDQRDRLRRARHLGHRDGVRQVLPAAGDRAARCSAG